MAGTLPSRQLCVTIERPPGEVYDFASLPENFPKWAAGLGNSVTRAAGGWIAQTAQGPLRVRFTRGTLSACSITMSVRLGAMKSTSRCA